MIQTRSQVILWVNILLCVGIAGVLGAGPALRDRRATAADSTSTAAGMASAAPMRQEASVVGKELVASEARVLRGEIRSLRDEAKEELRKLSAEQQESRRQWRNRVAEHAKWFADRRKEQGIELSEDELKLEFTPETLLEESTAEKLPKYVYEILCNICEERWVHAQEQVPRRIQARKMLLEALEKSSATDAELEKVKRFFADLEEFDRNLELRNYTAEECPMYDVELYLIIAKAREVSSEGLAWATLEGTLHEEGLGSFVLLPEDYEGLHSRANEREDDGDDE